MVFGGGSEGGGGSGHRGLFSSACGSSSFVFGLIYFLSSSPCDRGVTGEPSSCYMYVPYGWPRREGPGYLRAALIELATTQPPPAFGQEATSSPL
jgi:hypothetical protein